MSGVTGAVGEEQHSKAENVPSVRVAVKREVRVEVRSWRVAVRVGQDGPLPAPLSGVTVKVKE